MGGLLLISGPPQRLSAQAPRRLTVFNAGSLGKPLREALAAYAMHRPDLVLMDVEMKTMNGFDATREIKRDFPDARVVIVSQWDSPALREAAKEAGAEAYVNKKSLIPLRQIIEAG